VRPHVTEYPLHTLACAHCGAPTAATLPAGVPRGAFGPQRAATVAVCAGSPQLLESRKGRRMASLWKIAVQELRPGAIVAVCLLAFMTGMTPAVAGEVNTGDQHLSPDNTGFIPPNVFAGLGRYDPVTQCEVQVARNLNAYANCTLSCGRGHGTANPTACASNCMDLFHRVLTPALERCPPCLDSTAQDQAADIFRTFIEDGLQPIMYCDPGATASAKVCGDKVSAATAKLIKCITRGQLERAIYELRTAEQEVQFENKCQADYEATVGRIKGCPSCLSLEVAHGLGDTVREFMDLHSDLPFCQQ